MANDQLPAEVLKLDDRICRALSRMDESGRGARDKLIEYANGLDRWVPKSEAREVSADLRAYVDDFDDDRKKAIGMLQTIRVAMLTSRPQRSPLTPPAVLGWVLLAWIIGAAFVCGFWFALILWAKRF